MKTNLRKKNSFWKDIYNIYSVKIKTILSLITVPLIIFIPYYTGRLFATIPFLASIINTEKDEFLQVLRTWIFGNAIILMIIAVSIIIFGVIPILASAIKNKNTLHVKFLDKNIVIGTLAILNLYKKTMSQLKQTQSV